MNFKFLLLAIPAVIAAPASAQSAGGHVDVEGGWDHLPIPDQTGSTAVDTSRNRLIYGGGGGYDVKIAPSVTLGIDADYDLGSKTGCRSSIVIPGASVCGKMVRDIDVGGRVGVTLGPVTLYGRAGYDNLLLRSTYTVAPGATAATASNAYSGFRLSAGVQVPLTGPLYAKVEYRWTDERRIQDQQQLLTGIGIRF